MVTMGTHFPANKAKKLSTAFNKIGRYIYISTKSTQEALVIFFKELKACFGLLDVWTAMTKIRLILSTTLGGDSKRQKC